ncbi:P-loop NTPase fold protein [Legionella rowbothamii]|uniref:P-loop NTPase fold protein n=1 Tax=Legionella rowbothamii TaxID=96229 RepID=UPI0010566AE5|nr:P-loop NTPase fold protein [Legionella rowbothamii]
MCGLKSLYAKWTPFKVNNDIEKSNRITDTSITNINHDRLKVSESIIPRILDIIKDESYFPLTLALTGEWGAGKTSVINLLKSNLAQNKNNVVISFDPLIEGKQTVNELIELFYLKVIQQVDNKAVKKAFKKLFLSMLTIIRFKTSLQYRDPVQPISLSFEKDWAADVEKLIQVWEKNVQQLPSQQFQEINSILLQSEIKLYVFIDEIDRLSSEQIIPFLLFSRVMESIEPLVCVMGLDYNRTIRKLVVENKLGSSGYNDVKFYLDKLITLSFHVEATLDNRVEFLSELLITHHICNKEFIYEFSHQLREICYYLVTPRGIKKLVILASANKQLIKFSGNMILFLQLLAIEVKNPIIKEYLAKHETILHIENIKREPGYSHLLKKQNPQSEQDILKLNNQIKKVLLGILDPDLKLTEADSVALYDMTPYFITDHFNSNYILDILGLPRSLLHAYVRNLNRLEDIKVYFDFFQGDFHGALEKLVDMPNQNIAADISLALINKVPLQQRPEDINLETLNKLWLKNVNFSSGSPYTQIALYLSSFVPLEKLVDTNDLFLSKSFIANILSAFNITNNNGVYNLDHFRENIRFLEESLEDVSFRNNSIKNFSKEDIREILNIWLQKLSFSLEKKDPNLIETDNSIGLFYRYIQWGKALGQDNRGKLSNYVSSVLNNSTVSEGIKINFCRCVISAGDFNTSFPQKTHRHIIFEELFGSSFLQSNIEEYAAK